MQWIGSVRLKGIRNEIELNPKERQQTIDKPFSQGTIHSAGEQLEG